MKGTLILLLIALLSNGVALAEGGCPPGQYPYETPQARQCVPIPGGESPGQPAMVFENRWGAVAADSVTGNLGVAVGEVSKRNAKKVALQRCGEVGRNGCKVQSTFYNQCIAFADGGGFQASATAATEAEAKERAMTKCTGSDNTVCTVSWFDCSSLPEQVR